jgi:hypothetical protein
MINPRVLSSFFDSLSKEAAMSTGQKALLGTGLAVGTGVGMVAKDAYQDAQEGRSSRVSRELQQKQQLKALQEV